MIRTIIIQILNSIIKMDIQTLFLNIEILFK